ncbi:MAG: alpha-amylase, partial [Bacilli bacterium]|nr:alpha-amylase [Bacilli bacterium]
SRDIIWLSESVCGPSVKEIRDSGFDCASESEIYQVFDMAYDYDVRPFLDGYLDKKISLRNYQEAILAQEWTYPKNYVKLRNIENHDTRRIADWLDGDLDRIMNHTAFMFFQKGATMIYNGQEFLAKHRLSLFEKEQIDKNGDISTFIMKLAKLKKSKLFVSGVYKVIFPETEDVAGISYEDDSLLVIGIFNLGGVTGAIKIGLPDGKYRNYLDGKIMTVKNGMIGLAKEPVILRIQK